MILGDVSSPCGEIIDSLLLTYEKDTIHSKYYREFWSRRKAENNARAVYEVLQEVREILYADKTEEVRPEYVNDTLYRLIQLRELEDSLTEQKAMKKFTYLKNIGLHQSAYNLLYERYRYYDINWNQEALEKT